VWLRSVYIPQTSLLTNVVHIAYKMIQCVATPMHKISENDIDGINQQRLLYELTSYFEPLYDVQTTDINVTSIEGHVIPVQLYKSEACVATKCPLVVYYHGGGFVVGNIKMYRHITTALASLSGVAVAAVEYRLGIPLDSALLTSVI
jgi:acetyl esterase